MTDTETKVTLEQFIADNKIDFKCQWIAQRPDRIADDWDRGASHYKCRVTCGRRGFTLYFSQGSAHTSPPTIADVLDCLASDAAGYENARGFEEWAGEYGYDTDSRKAERLYRTVKRQAEQLKRMIGEEA